ncbi:putative dihydroxyacetone kinase [Gorgonomyces haynaldii]|nr:putative dihydroxyacetone kinase [Gorgonomyces haynaldii]
MKTVFGSSQHLVENALLGQSLDPNLRLIAPKTIVRDDIDAVRKRQVTLLCGGGSGHEPAHVGFVGQGMLSAAVCGDVFASPSTKQILTAIDRIQSPHGTLVIIKNYTGDVLNFTRAVEMAKARGIRVEQLIVGDDVAVGRSKSRVGRRGLAGTVLVHKIAGSAAEQGYTLPEIVSLIQGFLPRMGTIGVGFEHCTIPGQTHDPIPTGMVEIGMGIHNEPGFVQTPFHNVPQLLKTMLNLILNKEDPERGYVEYDDHGWILLLNNLGGVSQLEMSALAHETMDQLQLKVDRVLVGSLMTSLNMPGFSITLCQANEHLLELLDRPTVASGWPKILSALPKSESHLIQETHAILKSDILQDPITMYEPLEAALKSVIAAEPEITRLDTILGDGDCGLTLAHGAQAMIDAKSQLLIQNSPSAFVHLLATIVDDNMSGTSAALYSIFLHALSASLIEKDWIQASKLAIKSLQKATPARVGDRTLMDALIPFIDHLPDLKVASQQAEEGALKTAGMKASFGRSSYISDDQILHLNAVDAGAWAVYVFTKSLSVHLT